MRARGFPERGSLRKRERFRLGPTGAELLIEMRHETCRGNVLDRPQSPENVSCTREEKSVHETHPVIASWDIGRRACPDACLARAENQQSRLQIQAEHLVYFESPIVASARFELDERE